VAADLQPPLSDVFKRLRNAVKAQIILQFTFRGRTASIRGPVACGNRGFGWSSGRNRQPVNGRVRVHPLTGPPVRQGIGSYLVSDGYRDGTRPRRRQGWVEALDSVAHLSLSKSTELSRSVVFSENIYPAPKPNLGQSLLNRWNDSSADLFAVVPHEPCRSHIPPVAT
jgi:hypothetical protein